jgi:hypothetical protein
MVKSPLARFTQSPHQLRIRNQRLMCLGLFMGLVSQRESLREVKMNLVAAARERATYRLKKLSLEVFWGQKVQQKSLKYLENCFKKTQVHNALLFLVVGVIKDPLFVARSKIFGIDLIQHAIKQRTFLN